MGPRTMTTHNPYAGVGSRSIPNRPQRDGAGRQAGNASVSLKANIAPKDQPVIARPALVPTLLAETEQDDVGAWEPTDPRLTPPHWYQPPEFVESYRAHQWRAAVEVIEHFENGIGLVFVDAPTGSGKTLLADLISRMMAQPAIYLCTTKGLQHQIENDLDYARVLKGRANYRPMFTIPGTDATCEDCTGTNVAKNDCRLCDPMHECPYRVAKADAIRSQLAVLNVAYWLREANLVTKPAFSLPPDPNVDENAVGRRRREGGLFIIDECDTLEDQLLGYIEFQVGDRLFRELEIEPPKKGVHKKTIKRWMEEELAPALKALTAKYQITAGVEAERRARRLSGLYDDAVKIAEYIEDDNWMRDYEREKQVPFSMKPVTVDGFGNDLIWRHGGKFVLMSATIISAEEMVRTLGYEGEYAVVRVPSTFPKENHPIHVAPVADMRYKVEEQEMPKMVHAVRTLLEMHPDVNVLVHAVSYGRAQKVIKELKDVWRWRPLITYTNARERERAIRDFKENTNAVLVAPSLERGVDLPQDQCRVQIVLKTPYPNISDPRVNARAHGPDGEGWMAVQTIRALVQMTGRAVRSSDDWAETYILDTQFVQRIWKRNRDLLPQWWVESVDMRYRTRDLIRRGWHPRPLGVRLRLLEG